MSKYEINGVTLHGSLADIAKEITPEEWAFFDLAEDVSDQISVFMESKGITKAELAERMQTSKAFITKVLRGESNMTFKTLAKILHNLGGKAEVRIVRKQDGIKWFGIVEQRKKRGHESIHHWRQRGEFEKISSDPLNICETAQKINAA